VLGLVDHAAVALGLQLCACGELGVADLAFAEAEVDRAEEVAEVFGLHLFEGVVLERDGAFVGELHGVVFFVDRVELLVELLEDREGGDVADQVSSGHDRISDRALVPVGQQVGEACDVLFFVHLRRHVLPVVLPWVSAAYSCGSRRPS